MLLIKDLWNKFIHSRVLVTSVALILCFSLLIGRVFYLQILHGDEYQEDYTLSILKTVSTSATRGTIYDRNGNVLAYDRLSYAVTFIDSGDYDYEEMNEKLSEVISIIQENGDTVDEVLYLEIEEDGSLSYTVSGTTLARFRADVYGHSYISDLEYNEKLGYDEAEATAQQLFEYLCDTYSIYLSEEDVPEDADITTVYDTQTALLIANIRYQVAQNAYQKYIETTVASDVSDETVAAIMENSDSILGLDISQETLRVYNDSEYFAHVIGYTGAISSEEYEELSAQRDDYTLTDTVGKSGIEEALETTLQGVKGSQTLYVDNVGTVLEVAEETDPVSGSDVYLTLDRNLQIAVYELLEMELASILYSKISDITTFNADYVSSSSDIVIPITDVYFALLNNNVIDIDAFSDDDAGTYEQQVYAIFEDALSSTTDSILTQLTSSSAADFDDLSDEMQDYMNYVCELLYDSSIIDRSNVDTDSDEYTAWKNGSCSLKEYIEYNISESNVDTSQLVIEDSYADNSEIYDAVIAWVQDQMITDSDYHKMIYDVLIHDTEITGYQICMILYEQEVFDAETDDDYTSLAEKEISAYTYLKRKIRDLEITPAQLALEPCNASCVIVDPDDGEVLACVSYPGYDNNKLANKVDSSYYASLVSDLSLPLLNHATQENTAPGSTFKMVTATAALTEGLVTVSETIEDEGLFEEISPSPSCWIYSSSKTTHGSINVMEALEESCNYFFYELGYRMATLTGTYSDDAGLSILESYAEAFGLTQSTGIEISESSSQASDSDAVRSAIGQGTNNYTTTALARYVAAIANDGTSYNLSLIYKIVDSDDNITYEFESEVYNTMDEVSDSTWEAVQTGMKMVVDDLSVFDDVETEVAGKTGTAQESTSHPSHALFVCYAPYDDPEMAMAVRIPYGYTSGNAAEAAAYIIRYYFGEADLETLLNELSIDGGSIYVSD